MKPPIYRRRQPLRLLLRWLLRLLAAALLLAVVGFFLLRSWTVYDEAGAHIRFPWSEEAS